MRSFLAASLIAFCVVAPVASACGTRAPEVQAQLDAEVRGRMVELATAAAAEADLVFVGKVTQLARPALDTKAPGEVTLAVVDTLKGAAAPTQSFAWTERVVLDLCDESKGFRNVGFGDGGTVIVYVRDGQLLRVAAADELRTGSLLSLDDERALVAAAADH